MNTFTLGHVPLQYLMVERKIPTTFSSRSSPKFPCSISLFPYYQCISLLRLMFPFFSLVLSNFTKDVSLISLSVSSITVRKTLEEFFLSSVSFQSSKHLLLKKERRKTFFSSLFLYDHD